MLFEPKWFRWVRWAGLTFFSVITLVPLYVMLSTAVKPLGEVRGAFTWIPAHLTLRPFADIWTTVPLGRFFLNSLIVCLSATVCSVVLAVFAAYAISRYRFPGRRAFSLTVLSTQMFPGILFLLPLFVLYRTIDQTTGLHLFGSRYGLILTYLTFSLPFSIWMLVGYFDSVPRQLDEAALVDGTSPLGALLRVVVPASVPGIVAVGVYAFMTAWGEVLFASVLTTDATKTLGVGLSAYSTQGGVYWNQVMAASLVVSVPVVAGFLLLQRYLVTGLTAGAVK
jgi:multiple sugar transport system permease protein